MAGFSMDIGIKKTIRVVSNAELTVARRDILLNTAAKIRDSARELAQRQMGDIAPGKVTGKLLSSIKISDFEPSPSGKTLALRVFSDRSVAVSKEGVFYGGFQEYGTGIYSDEPGAPKVPIKPKSKPRMHWIQYGRPYRGRFVKAKSRRRKDETTGKVTGAGSWDQFAVLIKGSKPKRYLRNAVSRQIYWEHVEAIRRSKHIIEVW